MLHLARLVGHLKKFAPAYIVLSASLGMTLAGYFYARHNAETHDRGRFEELVQATLQSIDRRAEAYAGVLPNLGALFAYSEHVSLKDFGAFWVHYDIGKKMPGIYLIGYCAQVWQKQKPEYEAGLKRNGFAVSNIQPQGIRSVYFPATFLYPFDVESNEVTERNAIGHDAYADPARRAAMDQARDTGQAVATRPVRFVNDRAGGPATIIYYPIYRSGLFLNTVADRQAALKGFVYVAFHTRELFAGIPDNGGVHSLDYEVFANRSMSPATLLYDDNAIPHYLKADAAVRFHTELPLAIAGQRWLLRFYTLPGFDRDSSKNIPLYVLGSGLVISFMLFGMVLLISRNAIARRMAEEAIQMNEVIKESEIRVRAIVDHVADGIVTTDEQGTIETFNPVAAYIFGYAADEVIGRNIAELVPDLLRDPQVPGLQRFLPVNDNRGVGQNTTEITAMRKDQTVFPMELAVSSMQLKDQRMLVGILRDISQRKKNEEQLTYLAQFDSLTGLPNRHLFRDRLNQAMARAIRQQDRVALMFIDLDRFKEINDHLGHETGDLVLTMAAQRIRACLRESDTVARLGGDEFTVILEAIEETHYAEPIAQKILGAFSEPFVFEGMEFMLTASIGITFYPQDAQTIDGLLKRADMAMYKAKEAGRNDYRLFSPEIDAAASERIHLKNHLQHALDRGELQLHYQPQVDIQTGMVTGVEALLRWNHPELGMVSPARFIPLAEETGLIIPIGEWVLMTAARQNVEWQQAGLPPVKVAVNVSARQLRQESFAERVADILRETGVQPALMELEITEGLLIENMRYGQAALAQLRGIGLHISLDDFGTGYSSLSYLKSLPLDYLKMDISFVRHLAAGTADAEHSQAIARTIVMLAHSLNLKVVAEGVETHEQLAALRSMGCDQMQGYLFSRPLPPEDITQLLQQKISA